MLSSIKVYEKYTEFVYELRLNFTWYKINEKYVEILQSFTNLTMNVSKNLEYFLYIGKDNSMKKSS